jgi:hypothetical protein
VRLQSISQNTENVEKGKVVSTTSRHEESTKWRQIVTFTPPPLLTDTRLLEGWVAPRRYGQLMEETNRGIVRIM